MANLIKLGRRYLNLDLVADVEDGPAGNLIVVLVGPEIGSAEVRGRSLTFSGDDARALRRWLDRTAIDAAALDGPEPPREPNPAADLLAEVQAALKAPGGPLPKLEAVRAAVARVKGEGRERRDGSRGARTRAGPGGGLFRLLPGPAVRRGDVTAATP